MSIKSILKINLLNLIFLLEGFSLMGCSSDKHPTPLESSKVEITSEMLYSECVWRDTIAFGDKILLHDLNIENADSYLGKGKVVDTLEDHCGLCDFDFDQPPLIEKEYSGITVYFLDDEACNFEINNFKDIDFKITFGKLQLSSRTTPDDLRKVFPYSYQETYSTVDYTNGIFYLYEADGDANWTFYFKNGYLARLELTSPC